MTLREEATALQVGLGVGYCYSIYADKSWVGDDVPLRQGYSSGQQSWSGSWTQWCWRWEGSDCWVNTVAKPHTLRLKLQVCAVCLCIFCPEEFGKWWKWFIFWWTVGIQAVSLRRVLSEYLFLLPSSSHHLNSGTTFSMFLVTFSLPKLLSDFKIFSTEMIHLEAANFCFSFFHSNLSCATAPAASCCGSPALLWGPPRSQLRL